MPPLSIPWLRGRPLQAFLLSPAQRAVRVLQVTRANWHVGADGRRHRRSGAQRAGLMHGVDHANE